MKRYPQRQEPPILSTVAIITGPTVPPSPKQACSQFIKPAPTFVAKYVFSPVFTIVLPAADTTPNKTMIHQAGAQAYPRNPNPPTMQLIIKSDPRPILEIMRPLLKLITRETILDRSISVPIASREMSNEARIDGHATPNNPALRPMTTKLKKPIPMSGVLDFLLILLWQTGTPTPLRLLAFWQV